MAEKVVAILALVAVGLGGWAIYGLFLLCPLMHILTMRGYKRTNYGEDNQREE